VFRPQRQLEIHQARLRECRACGQMIGPVVTGQPVASSILLVGQAPGEREGELGRPFAWTAGKTLFKWFESIGLDETSLRRRVYMAAVCRCFPGKRARGGDRVPSPGEIGNCRRWLDTELDLLRPRLLIPVGKLAIAQFLTADRLTDVIGRRFRIEPHGVPLDCIPLPHPSGASTWHRAPPGKALLQQALTMLAEHPAWKAVCAADAGQSSIHRSSQSEQERIE
jgi:uracil-DNA glycosylase